MFKILNDYSILQFILVNTGSSSGWYIEINVLNDGIHKLLLHNSCYT